MNTQKNYVVFSKSSFNKSGTIKSIKGFSTREAARNHKRMAGKLRDWGIYKVVTGSFIR
jgi:hypothetical protein